MAFLVNVEIQLPNQWPRSFMSVEMYQHLLKRLFSQAGKNLVR